MPTLAPPAPEDRSAADRAATAEVPPRPPSGAVLAEQFDDLDQQREADTLGMWVFLATEVLLFSTLILGFVVYRFLYPEAWHVGTEHTKFWIGSANTAVLLTSSLVMALAVHAAKEARWKAVTWLLVGTAALGALFLGLKGLEYYLDLHEGFWPGAGFDVGGPLRQQVELFVVFYYCMTGLHALHMTIGIGVVLTMAILAHRGTMRGHMHVEMTGLYWHLVDIVWLFLYPLLYLAGG